MNFRERTRRALPKSWLRVRANFLLRVRSWRNSRESPEWVFTRIYAKNQWGGSPGEFFSGAGTVLEGAPDAYFEILKELSVTEAFKDATFVDLGCGDFRIGRRIAELSSAYVGVDVVRGLVEYNQTFYGRPRISFRHLDITTDSLPSGDVCLVRQVLQHLSNEEIGLVLEKLQNFRWVIITEHHPSTSDFLPNLDKVHGADIRLRNNSGVVLSSPPFSISPATLRLVMEYELPKTDDGRNLLSDEGILRTYLWTPNIASDCDLHVSH